MVQICQKEHSNHTHVIVPGLTDFAHVLQPKLDARLLSAVASRVGQYLQLNKKTAQIASFFIYSNPYNLQILSTIYQIPYTNDMIPFKNRFHGHSSLSYVYKNGTAIRSKFMTLKYATNKHRKDSRIAVVVSKKVLKSAVRRNRIRRCVYEYIHPRLNHLRVPMML